MIDYELDASALRRAADVLEDATPELVDDAAEAFVRDAGDVAERAVKRRAGRHRVTGAMEARITGAVSGDGVRAEARVVASDRIAALIVHGTAAHVIEPLHGRALRLASPAQTFARRVHHPGTLADPFVAEAFAETIDAAEPMTDDAGDRLAGGLADELKRRA